MKNIIIDLCQLTERFSKTTTDGDTRRTRSLSDAKINKQHKTIYLVLKNLGSLRFYKTEGDGP